MPLSPKRRNVYTGALTVGTCLVQLLHYRLDDHIIEKDLEPS